MTILVIVAHSDDQVFGPGGTVAKYSSEGEEIRTIIFSYGETSHPHFKKEIIRKIRVKEALEADKILGGNGVIFLGAPDGHIKSEEERLKRDLKDLFLLYKPKKIFTHAEDEALPDHVIVNKIVTSVYDELHETKKMKIDIYTFGIWRFFKLSRRYDPKLYVDITDYFAKKLETLKVFKSQTNAMLVLKWSVYVKALVNGFKINKPFAEVFYKIR